MTDVVSVRRTVRRCTAVLIATLGLVVVLVGPAETTLYGLAMAWLGVMYVAASLVVAGRTPTADDGLSES